MICIYVLSYLWSIETSITMCTHDSCFVNKTPIRWHSNKNVKKATWRTTFKTIHDNVIDIERSWRCYNKWSWNDKEFHCIFGMSQCGQESISRDTFIINHVIHVSVITFELSREIYKIFVIHQLAYIHWIASCLHIVYKPFHENSKQIIRCLIAVGKQLFGSDPIHSNVKCKRMRVLSEDIWRQYYMRF